jgi:hypothetical protein
MAVVCSDKIDMYLLANVHSPPVAEGRASLRGDRAEQLHGVPSVGGAGDYCDYCSEN